MNPLRFLLRPFGHLALIASLLALWSCRRLLGDRDEMPQIGVRRRAEPGALDRWAEQAVRVADADRPVAVFANNRFEGSGFATAADLRARSGRPAPEPHSLWPAPPLPGLEQF